MKHCLKESEALYDYITGTDVYNPGGYRIEVNNGTEVVL